VNARILPLDSDAHRRAQELLPWWVNGTLDELEAAQTRDHLARCTVCQDDAAALAKLRDMPFASSPREDVDLGWVALKASMVIRIPIVLAITPFIARFVAKRRAAKPPPEPELELTEEEERNLRLDD